MAIRRHLFILVLVANTVSAAAQDKDKLVANGELVFHKCQSCHFVGDKKLEKHGPHLNDLFGRMPGGLPDYTYSLAMHNLGKDKVWDEATLTQFLHDPMEMVVGTNMRYSGLKKSDEILAVLAYLATFDKDGMAPK